uniref:Uncharacterized protein n=1 Tax=Eutreptiella gymnastica TaxID=73025 RepID=A0A7S4LJH8_9EUGL
MAIAPASSPPPSQAVHIGTVRPNLPSNPAMLQDFRFLFSPLCPIGITSNQRSCWCCSSGSVALFLKIVAPFQRGSPDFQPSNMLLGHRAQPVHTAKETLEW